MEDVVNPLAEDLDHILSHTRDLWEEFRNQWIFITGGTGFFGCWLLESFIWANEHLGLNAKAVVLTREPGSFVNKAPHLANHPCVQLIKGDVRSFEFPAGSFSHVIHMATDASQKLNSENPLLMMDTIVQGTKHTLEFAHICGSKKFLLFSSGAVYGKQPANLSNISEQYTGAPDTSDPAAVYGESKRLAELLCLHYHRHYSIECKIIRGFAFVGPYLPLDIHFAIGNFLNDALKKQSILVKGDGTPYRSYLYAADAIIWLLTILYKGKSNYPYNIGSEEALTIKDLAKRIGDMNKPPLEVIITNKPVQGKSPERYVPSTMRACSELGLTQYTGLDEAIYKTVQWYSK